MGKMKKKNVVFNLAVMLIISVLIVRGLDLFNFWFGFRWKEVWGGGDLGLPMHHMFFAEGIMFLLLGFLLLLGSGGINLWTISAILNSSVADWIYGKESNKEHVRPSEILRVDRWQPKGLPYAGLICIFAGIIMILTYFHNFFILGW